MCVGLVQVGSTRTFLRDLNSLFMTHHWQDALYTRYSQMFVDGNGDRLG